MTTPDPLDALLAAVTASTAPVDPDPAFAVALRTRIERALLEPPPSDRETAMTSTATPSTTVRPGEVVYTSVWTPDVTRAAAFYGAVLGWRVEGGARGRLEGAGAIAECRQLRACGGQFAQSRFGGGEQPRHLVIPIADTLGP